LKGIQELERKALLNMCNIKELLRELKYRGLSSRYKDKECFDIGLLMRKPPKKRFIIIKLVEN
jgi:hypothetical protein